MKATLEVDMTTWEYMHVWVEASTVKRSGGFLGTGKKTETSPYPFSEIQAELNRKGEEGWELVGMEPRWYWERVGISAGMEITHPFAITGWYCTFKRAK